MRYLPLLFILFLACESNTDHIQYPEGVTYYVNEINDEGEVISEEDAGTKEVRFSTDSGEESSEVDAPTFEQTVEGVKDPSLSVKANEGGIHVKMHIYVDGKKHSSFEGEVEGEESIK